MLKILHTKYVNQEPPEVQAGFRKGRGTRDQIANIHWIKKKLENSKKTSTSASLTMIKPLTVQITTNCVKFLGIGKPDHLTCLLWNLYASQEATVRTRRRMDIQNWTGSKLGKEYMKAVYCYPAYLTYMQSMSCEMQGWMKHKLESRLAGEISITSDMQMTPL